MATSWLMLLYAGALCSTVGGKEKDSPKPVGGRASGLITPAAGFWARRERPSKPQLVGQARSSRAAPESERSGGASGGARRLFGRAAPSKPRRTSYSDFIKAVKAEQREGGVVTDVQIGAESIRYKVRGEERECAVLPSSTPSGLVDLLSGTQIDFAGRDPAAELDGRGLSQEGLARVLAFLVWTLCATFGYFLLSGRGADLMGKGGGFSTDSSSPGTRIAPADGFAAVAGLESVTAELAEMIQMLNAPEQFARFGIRPARGVLLVGPPGTGKTLLARAVAAEAGVRFFARAGPEFHSPWVGTGAKNVRELFRRARDPHARTPAVIFIDEIDALGAARAGAGGFGAHREHDATLTQLLACMDGAEQAPAGRPLRPGERVLVIGATNRYGVLDSALTRPGRFDRVIQVKLPGARARERILKLHCSRLFAPIDADLGAVARRAQGMSGAQLAALANEAAVRAYRRGAEARISEDDFAAALVAVRRPAQVQPSYVE